MSLQCLIHREVQDIEMCWVHSNQVRGEFLQSRSDTSRVRWQIERTERADFSIAHQAGIGLDFNHRAVEHIDRLAARPRVLHLMEREIDLVC